MVARATSPLILGVGDGESGVASDVPALLPYTRRVIYLHDGDLAVLARDGVRVARIDGSSVERPVDTVDWDAEAAEKGGYPHFMIKETYEQPDVLQQTLGGRFTADGHDVLLGLEVDPAARPHHRHRRRHRLVRGPGGRDPARGGRSRAGRRRGRERDALPRPRHRPANAGHRRVPVRRDDRHAGGRAEARRRGARTLAILNVKGSSLAREVDDVLYIHAGPEIAVASTKAYAAMLAAFGLLAVRFGHGRGRLSMRGGAAYQRAARAAAGRPGGPGHP